MEPSNKKQILMFLHCGVCLKELAEGKHEGESASSMSSNDIGWTKKGLQIWCTRHNVNVCHIDFEGQQHPANLTMERKK